MRVPGDEPPPLGDALLRLDAAVGTRRALELAQERLLAAYAPPPPRRREALADPSWALARPSLDGIGPAAAEVWAEASERAPAAVRIATMRDERRWADGLRPSGAARAVDAVAGLAVGAAGAISPETSLVATLLGAGLAAADSAAGGVPPGSRAGDALVCTFSWRRNAAVPGWAAAHPVDAGRLALGRRYPAVDLVVVRAGAVVARAAVRSDATSC